MKKKYTVVYSGPRLDSYNTRITSFKHIETDNLAQAIIDDENIGDWCSVWFVFDGHCQLTED